MNFQRFDKKHFVLFSFEYEIMHAYDCLFLEVAADLRKGLRGFDLKDLVKGYCQWLTRRYIANSPYCYIIPIGIAYGRRKHV